MISNFEYTVIGLITLFSLIFLVQLSASSQSIYGQPVPTRPLHPVYVITTINETGDRYHNFVGDISKLYSTCPPEVVLLVHGWDPSIPSALESLDRASMSMDTKNLQLPVVGFLWNSATPSINVVALNAEKAGNGLANFLIDSKIRCPHTALDIAAHSAGTRVVKSAFDRLDSNNGWKVNQYKLKIVAFLGAAIGSTTPDIKTPFGNFIKNSVNQFANLYSLKDILLPIGGPQTDLGLNGIKPGTSHPLNYKDRNVLAQLINNNDANGDGKCDLQSITHRCVSAIGENHLGYWGFRDTSKHLVNDGAMDIVVSLIRP
jgi:hypothetical protein